MHCTFLKLYNVYASGPCSLFVIIDCINCSGCILNNISYVYRYYFLRILSTVIRKCEVSFGNSSVQKNLKQFKRSLVGFSFFSLFMYVGVEGLSYITFIHELVQFSSPVRPGTCAQYS